MFLQKEWIISKRVMELEPTSKSLIQKGLIFFIANILHFYLSSTQRFQLELIKFK